jgi:hypothetical protein
MNIESHNSSSLLVLFERDRKLISMLTMQNSSLLKHWSVYKNSCQDSNDTEISNDKLDLKADNHSV